MTPYFIPNLTSSSKCMHNPSLATLNKWFELGGNILSSCLIFQLRIVIWRTLSSVVTDVFTEWSEELSIKCQKSCWCKLILQLSRYVIDDWKWNLFKIPWILVNFVPFWFLYATYAFNGSITGVSIASSIMISKRRKRWGSRDWKSSDKPSFHRFSTLLKMNGWDTNCKIIGKLCIIN